MIELSQKEIDSVSGGTLGLIGKVVAFKVNVVKSIFSCLTPKPPVCQPVPQPCPPQPCPEPEPAPEPGCDENTGDL
ncbi:hypothetical protein [Acinetobacter shaoyimingii]|uniref:Uncharacterized protein n=1 Tax=Acinetobacter shaoyimingii TaxID=2715164 RepID=A0A6G8RTN1_9GAMM|nr:hypothetical protein [Acinetobacter shaoyimingii]NHB58912.1 hypothetical protein [Acinetobacter shaoyimingii]QIO05292.1 hypothetical protein G8E00_04615 [Acinetobacter shaoyimingii]